MKLQLVLEALSLEKEIKDLQEFKDLEKIGIHFEKITRRDPLTFVFQYYPKEYSDADRRYYQGHAYPFVIYKISSNKLTAHKPVTADRAYEWTSTGKGKVIAETKEVDLAGWKELLKKMIEDSQTTEDLVEK